MNYSIIIYILGWIMNVEAVCMLVPGITALIYREKSGIAFLITILACLAIVFHWSAANRPRKRFTPVKAL